jgi:hypothetical protein
VQALLDLGEEQGHTWDGAAAGPAGITPLHIAAARPEGGPLSLLLAGRTAPGEHKPWHGSPHSCQWFL